MRTLLADEQGVEVLEFVAFTPWLLVVGLVIWQFLVFSQVALVAPSAAREAARAAAAYRDCQGFAHRAAGRFEHRVQCGACSPYGPVEARVSLRLPIIDIPYVPVPEVQLPAQATFRCEPPE